jgi:hypothetical protein
VPSASPKFQRILAAMFVTSCFIVPRLIVAAQKLTPSNVEGNAYTGSTRKLPREGISAIHRVHRSTIPKLTGRVKPGAPCSSQATPKVLPGVNPNS